jgi:3-dehydroquinate synthase
MAEVIKYGVIRDRELFDLLVREREKILSLDDALIAHIVKRSCEIKAEVVSQDEREGGLRAILNFGHTVGHAVETVTGYATYLHGEAVAIGMHLAARLAAAPSLLKEEDVMAIRDLIAGYGLPVELPAAIDRERILAAMNLDKKTLRGRLTFVLPESIGAVRITGVDDREKIGAALAP